MRRSFLWESSVIKLHDLVDRARKVNACCFSLLRRERECVCQGDTHMGSKSKTRMMFQNFVQAADIWHSIICELLFLCSSRMQGVL